MDKSSNSSSLFERFVPVIVLLTVVLAFMVGVLWQKVSSLEKGGTVATTGTQPAAPAAVNVSLDTIKDLFNKDLVKFGDANRKLLFVEVSDPSCPFCHAAGGENHSIYKDMGDSFKLVSEGGTYVSPVAEMRKLVADGKASFVWIYSPGHGSGEMGTKALFCAYEKGKFWEAHDLLMSEAGYTLLNTTVQNDKTKSQVMADFLKNAVDPKFIKDCLDSGKYDARLAADPQISATLGYQGTPDFFVNATNYAGAVSWNDMKSVVEAALK